MSKVREEYELRANDLPDLAYESDDDSVISVNVKDHVHSVSSGAVLDRNMKRRRTLALVCVCLMSVGSHFGTYLLGPLKSRLHREMGTSNAQFSLLISSFTLNSTWTPLVAGLLVTRFGSAWSSVATTGCVLMGQIILFLGVMTGHLNIMISGLFIFGLGLTPLSVVQESLLSTLSAHSHIGISLALGLVSGKSSSFISSLVSLPLAEKHGDILPFGIAVGLCTMSFSANLMRLGLGWGQVPEKEVLEGRRIVRLGGLGELGDVYWVYILMNILCGAVWTPFIHLSANLLQSRYGVTEDLAAMQSSVLLAGAIILYPIVGHITDRLTPSSPKTTFHLLHIASALTLLGFAYLNIEPTTTQSPWIGMILYALGNGSATLLLVILIPRILPSHLVPLGLGLHKSMEMASSTFTQTIAGVWLDTDVGDNGFGAGQRLLRVFCLINILQLMCAVVLWRMESWKRKGSVYQAIPLDEVGQEGQQISLAGEPDSAVAKSPAERQRGRVIFGLCVGSVVITWIVFGFVAWKDLE